MPDWKEEIRRRLSSLNLFPTREAEIIEELAQHLEDRCQELLWKGTPESEAIRVTLEEIRRPELLQELKETEIPLKEPIVAGSVERTSFLADFWQDLRYGAHKLINTPAFTIVSILTLALGIGANTAVFTLLNAIMLRSLPVRDPQQLVILSWTAHHLPHYHLFYGHDGCPMETSPPLNPTGCSISQPMFDQLRAENRVFSGVSAIFPRGRSHVSIERQYFMARVELVSGNYFSTLGIPPAAGRLFGPADDTPSSIPVAVISYSFWKTRLGGDLSAIGKVIRLHTFSFAVVGIAQPEFTGLENGLPNDIWLPLMPNLHPGGIVPTENNDAEGWWLLAVARLKPDISLEQAQAATNVIFKRGVLQSQPPLLNAVDNPQVQLISIKQGLSTLQRKCSRPLLFLLLPISILLLIACTNLASLMSVRATIRQKELATRLALGASRWRIVRQLLAESLLLALSGGIVGLFFAYASACFLAAFLSYQWYGEINVEVVHDIHVLAFALAITLFTGILFGMMPALRGSRINLAMALKQSNLNMARNFAWRSRFGPGRAIIVMQVILSMVLLAGATLLARSLANLKTVDVGFNTQHLLLLSIDPEEKEYSGQKRLDLYSETQRRLSSLPGVISAGFSDLPLLAEFCMTYDVFFHDSPKKAVQVNFMRIGPGYFETMGIPLVMGRTFDLQDLESSLSKSPPKIVIANQTLVNRYLGNKNPLGERIAFFEKQEEFCEIVGVVKDAKYDSVRKGIEPILYQPFEYYYGDVTFAIRTAMAPEALIPSIRQVVSSIGGDLTISHLQTQTEQIDRTIWADQLIAWISSVFALLALFLSCVGLYGVISHEVTRRINEIGIRMALGASQKNVLWLMIRRNLWLVVLGAGLGIGVAAGLSRYLRSMLFGISPLDPSTYILVAVLMCLVAFAACYLPARRAARVDPIETLRFE
jgi:predicted permease